MNIAVRDLTFEDVPIMVAVAKKALLLQLVGTTKKL